MKQREEDQQHLERRLPLQPRLLQQRPSSSSLPCFPAGKRGREEETERDEARAPFCFSSLAPLSLA